MREGFYVPFILGGICHLTPPKQFLKMLEIESNASYVPNGSYVTLTVFDSYGIGVS